MDYDASGSAKDLQATLPAGGGTSYVVASASYAPAGQLSSLGIAGTPATPLFTSQFSYDGDQRLTESQATLTGAGAPFYDLTLGYDAASNVTGPTTTLPTAGSTPGGTDSQAFCYDEFARLVWAGTSGTPTGPAAGSCGPTPAGTTLSGAGYTATYAYDTLDRLTTGPAGTYTYGDSAHLHAVTSTSDGHSLAYDAAGNVNCRATASGGCQSQPTTGAPYTFDNEGRLAAWANKPTGATVTAAELSDGADARVERQTTSSGVLTTSVYIGALAEYDTTSGTTTTTDYLTFAGKQVAVHDTAWHYLLSDQLGTPEVQVGATGTPELDALKLPYGSTRYAAASLLNLGFTGQRKDSTPNITYFNARYYDQDLGAFLSADTELGGGLNRYAYVGDNPGTVTDPTGHIDFPPLDRIGPWLLFVLQTAAGILGAPVNSQTPTVPTEQIGQETAAPPGPRSAGQFFQQFFTGLRNAAQAPDQFNNIPGGENPDGTSGPKPDPTTPNGPSGGGRPRGKWKGSTNQQWTGPGKIKGPQIPNRPPQRVIRNEQFMIELNGFSDVPMYSPLEQHLLQANEYNQAGFDAQPVYVVTNLPADGLPSDGGQLLPGAGQEPDGAPVPDGVPEVPDFPIPFAADRGLQYG